MHPTLSTEPRLETVETATPSTPLAADQSSMAAAEDTRYAELLTLALDFARDGETETLARMIDAGIPVNLKNAKGHSLLMLAAYHGYDATVAMLLEHGADPDLRNDRGQTPLGGAAFKGHDAVVIALLNHGADPKADQGFGIGPIGYAMMFGRFGTAKLIRKHIAESANQAA